MSVRAQVIINLPSLRKMLLEDVAWVSYHCPKQARASASQTRSRATEADCGRNPLRFSFFINCSMRARSRAAEKPHQAGDAFISEATWFGCFSHPMQQLRTEAVAAKDP